MEDNKSLVARNFSELVKPTGNIYETTMVIAKRAQQIALQTREELRTKLEEFTHPVDTLEEVLESREHIEVSQFYERQPKPILVATKEFLKGQLVHRYKEKDTPEGV